VRTCSAHRRRAERRTEQACAAALLGWHACARGARPTSRFGTAPCGAAAQVRAHNAELIARAYTSIAPAKAAALLGLREAEAAERAPTRPTASSKAAVTLLQSGGSSARV